MAGEEEGGSLNEFVPDDMDDTGGLLPELQLMDASYVSHVPEAPEAFATEEGEDGEDGEEDEEGEEREECEEGEEGEEGEGEGSKASEALVTQTQRAPVSGNADGLDSASEACKRFEKLVMCFENVFRISLGFASATCCRCCSVQRMLQMRQVG